MRVAGDPEAVRAARERIMAVLDTRVSTELMTLNILLDNLFNRCRHRLELSGR